MDSLVLRITWMRVGLALMSFAVGVSLLSCAGSEVVHRVPRPTSTPAPPTATPLPPPPVSELLRQAKEGPHKITYEITQGLTRTPIKNIVRYVAPAHKERIDSSQTSETRSFYRRADGTFLCTIAGRSTSCRRASQEQALEGNAVALLYEAVLETPDGWSAAYLGTREVLTKAAHCFQFEPKQPLTVAGLTQAVLCFNSTNLPVVLEGYGERGEIIYTATALGTPTDSDFELPAQPAG